jgi:tetratricopeptide (TPR) repeat protein
MMRKTLTTVTLGAVVALTAGCVMSSGPFDPFDRGLTYYNNGQYFFAADSFSEAVRQDPTSSAAYVNRGVARVRLGEINAAIDDYNQAIQLKPSDPAIYFNRGNALVAGGHYGAAVEDFSRAVELSPVFAKAWFNRGTARSMSGQADAARHDWLHAIEIESDPWARAAMRRSAGLEAAPAMAVAGVPAGQPTTVGTVAPAPPAGMATDAVPLPPPATLAATPPTAPAASPPTAQSIDARTLATRAIGRELDGDHAGAIQDLRAALAIEQDPARRASLESLLRMLETPR